MPPAGFEKVLETAKIVHHALDALGMPNVAKTTGSKGMHVYVPIVRGPPQKQVWTFAKEMAKSLEQLYPEVITAEYRIEKRPRRPRPGRLQPERLGPHSGLRLLGAPEAPGHRLHAGDLGRGARRASASRTFASTTCPSGWRRRGDLWKPLLSPQKRFDLRSVLTAEEKADGHENLALPIKPPYPVMDAQLVAELPRGQGWQYEPKWDGFRCLAFRNGGTIELQSKSGKSLARYFPDVVDMLAVPCGAAFRHRLRAGDSRWTASSPSRSSSCGSIPAASRVRKLAAAHPATMIVFDLLVDEKGRLLAGEPLKERRKALERLYAKVRQGRRTVCVSRRRRPT